LPRGDVDWNKARETLLEILKINTGFTSDNCVIGGSAAWFYRTLLEKFPSVQRASPFRIASEKIKNLLLPGGICYKLP